MKRDLHAALQSKLEEAHRLFDLLWAGSRDQSIPERLRAFVTAGAGQRAASVLELERGKALARAWRDGAGERLGHVAICPCAICRDAAGILR